MTRFFRKWGTVGFARLAAPCLVGCSGLAACTGFVAPSDEARGQAAAPCVEQVEQGLVVCAASSEMLHGVDVSKWQGSIDWAKVSGAGVRFAFARVSDGVNTKDAAFVANFRAMKAAGLLRGAYQFFRPEQDPIAQAELMLTMLNEAGGLTATDLPPVLDLEADDGEDIASYQARAQEWLDHVQRALGRRPIVYSGARFESFTGQAFSSYPLWAPHYKTSYEDRCPNIADGWTRWRFWQWTSMGSIDGIKGAVDRDVFDGTLAELADLIQASIVPSALTDAGVDARVAAGDASIDHRDAAIGSDHPAQPAVPSHVATFLPDGGVEGTMGQAGREQTRDGIRTCR